jgi:hypothetical protein
LTIRFITFTSMTTVFQPKQTTMSLSDLTSPTSILRNKNCKIQLPANFIPTESSVICGRGKACTTSIGNRRLKSIVNSFLKPYSKAKNKLDKSVMVSSIVGAIKLRGGNFVKYEDRIWWEVDDAFAREKIGCMLRDYLHTQYRSSAKAKLARRNASKTLAEDSTFYFDTYLHQGMNTSNNSQSSLRTSTDASSSTAEEIYCPSPSVSHQPMMQGSIGQDAYMMPVDSMTNCVQVSSYDQQQPSKGMSSEYCSFFSNYIDQQQNRQCCTDFIRMTTSTSMGIIGAAGPTQETAGKQTSMSALVKARGLICEVQEIYTADDLADDISGIFEDWETEL